MRQNLEQIVKEDSIDNQMNTLSPGDKVIYTRGRYLEEGIYEGTYHKRLVISYKDKEEVFTGKYIKNNEGYKEGIMIKVDCTSYIQKDHTQIIKYKW